jgi:ABC-type multidrug transport system ATPase subunit
MVRIEDLVKGYETVRAIDGVTLDLAPGAIVALLGPNGAGKTTTFKCILGVTSFKGAVEVDGLSVKKNGRETRRRTGYLPQTPVFGEGDTCRCVLEFLSDLKGASRASIDGLLRRVDLWDQRDHRVGHLSGGMRQRLALAAALLADPPLLLLDEPTANLDLESRRRFHDLLLDLRGEGKTIVLSTHFVDGLVEIADRVIVLRQGKVVLDGAAAELSAGARPRFLVDLNGTAVPAFMQALEGVGIGPERVEPAGSHWEEIIAAASAAAPEADEEAEA